MQWHPVSLTAGESPTYSRLWLLGLVALGSVSSVIHPHAPLVAFAAVAGTTLARHRAIVAIAAIWLANQLYGYGIRQYPHTNEAMVWAFAMGGGALLVTGLASLRPAFSRSHGLNHLLWLGFSTLGGFVLYQMLIALVGWVQGLEHPVTLDLLGPMLLKEVRWAAGLGLLHLLLFRSPRRSAAAHN